MSKDDKTVLTKEESAWKTQIYSKFATMEEKYNYLKQSFIERGVRIGDTDHAKVTLLVNLTLNDRFKKTQEKEMNKLKFLCQKYSDLTVFGQFAYDVKEPEHQTNKELAKSLNKLGYLDDAGNHTIPNFKFLEKVSFQKPSYFVFRLISTVQKCTHYTSSQRDILPHFSYPGMGWPIISTSTTPNSCSIDMELANITIQIV